MLTKRQKQVLDFIRHYIDTHDYAPSLEEIKKHLRLSSVSTAHYHVEALKNMGYFVSGYKINVKDRHRSTVIPRQAANVL